MEGAQITTTTTAASITVCLKKNPFFRVSLHFTSLLRFTDRHAICLSIKPISEATGGQA